MSATNKTANYELPEFVGTDKPSWLTDFNGAMTKIDTALHELSQGQASGVTKQYVDEQIATVTTALNNLQDNVDAITAKLKNYLTVGTADVNSLYPSEMHSDSGNYYPAGKPKFWSGDYIPDMPEHAYYFVRVRCRFYLKDGMLPFIQIKNSFMYLGNVCLTTSDVWDDEQNSYCQELIMPDGSVKSTEVTLTLTMIDWILFKEHYELVDCVILDGCWFHSEIGLFDEYINCTKN